ncbi:TPA: TRAM domain-containing protein, partial [Candidatus Bathyarchaeota archaeon]|nr:TRAM domain-containing protein [Candidatus Bathyarchaeota archaeon]
GWVGEVLVDEKGKTRGSWIGRNFAYKPVVIQSSQNLLGKVICVKIVEICSTYLAAEIL